jgi:chromosome segregation ATPase
MVLGTLGGLEFIKWLFTRKQNSRMAETKADDAEFEKYQKQIDYANDRLLIKDQRIEEKDKLLSQKDDRYHELSQKFHELTLQVKKLNAALLKKEETIGDLREERAKKLCEVKKCANREPQSGY